MREAVGLHADVVGDLRRVLGKSDSLTLRTRYQYVAQLAQAGEDVAAVQLWRSLIPRLDAEQRTVGALGSDARHHLAEGILRLQGNQGAATRLRARGEPAEPAGRGARGDARGPDRDDRLGRGRGHRPGGAARLAGADQRLAAALGEHHPLTLLARFRLAEHSEGAGHAREARQLLLELMPALAAQQGPAGDLLLRARYLLALTTRVVDPAADLAQWEELAPELEALLGSGDRLTTDAWVRLALALAAQHREAEALPLLESVLPLPESVLPRRAELFGADDPVTLRGRCAMVAGVAAVHGEGAARPLWRVLLEDLTRALGRRHVLAREVGDRLGLAPESGGTRPADLTGLGSVRATWRPRGKRRGAAASGLGTGRERKKRGWGSLTRPLIPNSPILHSTIASFTTGEPPPHHPYV